MTKVNISMQSNEPKTYRIGMWIVFNGDLLLLSQVSPWEVAAVSPVTGNRFCDAVSVENPHNITKEEMRQILGYDEGEELDMDKVVVVEKLNIEVK